ncbi:MAG: PAS domain S-box protein, partial [Mailhella sp.]|nr:PAS domain S-box protein [Mailhella sp.]
MESILQHIEQLFEAFQDGIWISDDRSVCLYVNRKYEELTGLRRESMIGQKATSILEHGVFDAIVNPEVISTGKAVSKMQKLSNGKYLSLDGYPIFNETGRCIMCITFVRDISMLRAMEDKLSHQRDVLDRLIHINNTHDILTEE